jgi:hypothetical protein
VANPNRRGQVGSPVSTGLQGSDYTPNSQTSFFLPHGLQLRHAVGQAIITNVTTSGGVVTYTAANNFSVGDTVSIYGVSPVAYNLQNVTIASPVSSTQFRVTNGATGAFVSGGIAQKTGLQNVTIPSGITWVYAICAGPGGSSGASGNGGGGLSWGWTLAVSTCMVGQAISSETIPDSTKYTRYGHIIAGSGGSTDIGSSGEGGHSTTTGVDGSTNYYGTPGGSGGTTSVLATMGAGGGGGNGVSRSDGANATAGSGANGISGGGGGSIFRSSILTGDSTGGDGGSGLIGGGGGSGGTSSTGLLTGGSGGNGINILTGAVTTGGSGTTGTGSDGAGGGGAGIAGNGSNAIGNEGGLGGLGGGGAGGNGFGGTSTALGVGGAGVIYLFY